jgi:hypothetical protein
MDAETAIKRKDEFNSTNFVSHYQHSLRKPVFSRICTERMDAESPMDATTSHLGENNRGGSVISTASTEWCTEKSVNMLASAQHQHRKLFHYVLPLIMRDRKLAFTSVALFVGLAGTIFI